MPTTMSTRSPLTVAIDIDGTWTLDPQLFDDIANMFQEEGWTVIIVTGREQPKEKITQLGLYGWPIIVSGELLKQDAALKAGYNVNVWIDNEPGTIQQCKILTGELDDQS